MSTEAARNLVYQALSVLLEKTIDHENLSEWSKHITQDDDNFCRITYTCTSDMWTTWKLVLQKNKTDGKMEAAVYVCSEDECCPYYTGRFCKVITTKDIRKDDAMETLFDDFLAEVVGHSARYILTNNARGILKNYIDNNSNPPSYHDDESSTQDSGVSGNCFNSGGGFGSTITDEDIPF